MTAFLYGDPEFQRHIDMHAMRDHELKTRIASFIRALPPDQLVTLGDMLTMIGNFPDPRAGVMYNLGLVHEVLRSAHNRCICGVDHDAEAMAAEQAKLEAERNSAEEQRIREQYEKYHMEVDPEREGGIRCAKCKLPYSNLADRMLRLPDDCHGCKNKAAWG